jgi:GMP synthase PP-ATPase subunit
MSACRWWNEKHPIEKTWTRFKSHFAASHRQHKQIQGESAVTAGYHSANAAVVKTEDQSAEATIVALDNLFMATAADRGVVTNLTKANACLVKQLEDNSNELRELKALIKKERVKKRGQRSFTPPPTIIDVRMGMNLATHTQV